MALPGVKVRISADTRSAESGIDRVEGSLRGLDRQADRSRGKMATLDRSMAGAGRIAGGGFARGVQNASFQVGDFAVQVGGGVEASRALAQQLPQLLGGFGVFGAVLGAAAAILIPLRSAMQGMAADGRDMTEVFGTLQPAIQTMTAAFARMGEVLVTAAELVINNLDRIITIGATAAVFFGGRFIVSMVAARLATLSFAGSLVALRAALIRTGIGAVIVAAGELVFQFTRLVQAAGGFGQAMTLLGNVATEVWQRIQYGASLVGQILSGIAMQIQGAFVGAFATILESFARLTDTVAQGMNNLFGTNVSGIGSGAASAARAEADRLSSAGGFVASSAAGELGGLMSRPIAGVEKIRDLLTGMKENNITLDSILGLGGGDDEDGKKGKGGDGKSKSLKEKLSERAQAIKDHLDMIKALTVGALTDTLGAWGNYFQNLAQMMGTSNQKLLGIAKSFSAAQALIDAWRAHNLVLADPTLPWWARIASAGKVLASGLGAVNAIKSVGAGGSGGGAGGGGGAVGGAGGGATAAPQPLEARVTGLNPSDLFTGGAITSLFDRLQDEAGDRGLRVSFAQ